LLARVRSAGVSLRCARRLANLSLPLLHVGSCWREKAGSNSQYGFEQHWLQQCISVVVLKVLEILFQTATNLAFECIKVQPAWLNEGCIVGVSWEDGGMERGCTMAGVGHCGCIDEDHHGSILRCFCYGDFYSVASTML